jgi:transposase
MSKPMAETTKRRPRRQFDDDFKAQAVRLVLDEGKTVASVARDLDLTETALREWVNRARADRSDGQTLTTAEREELARLRKDNRILREEREILKKILMGSGPPANAMKGVCSGARARRVRSTPTGAISPEKNGPECRVSTSNCLPSV